MINVQNPDLAARARTFALERHGKQDHGCLDISEHLQDVAANVEKHWNELECYESLDSVLAAAWLHDVLEDTPTKSLEIGELFGDS